MSHRTPSYQDRTRRDFDSPSHSPSERLTRNRSNRQASRRLKNIPTVKPFVSMKLTARVFMRGLAFILLGYGVMGRGFAYLGFEPVYVGEMVLALGFVAMANSGAVKTAVRHPSMRMLLVFIGWSALMTFPYIPEYGMMALRDGALWGYSLYALIVSAVIIANPQMMRWLLIRYRTFVYVFLASAWAIWAIASMGLLQGLSLPGSQVDLFDIKGGDNLVHLAGIAAFVAVGMTRKRTLLFCGILFNFAFLATSKRAGMLAFLLAFGLLILLNPPQLKLAKIAYAAILSLTILLLVNPSVDLGKGRKISLDQMTSNVISMFDKTNSTNLEASKSWRIDWWTEIIAYSLSPRYIAAGKGYGVNLADMDGFQVLEDKSLRSPHNAHINVLARSGLIGFLLWFGVHAIWCFSMLRASLDAKKRSMPTWHGIFAFLLAYWVAIMVNASFDVYLEGPIGGIWLWSLIGFGIAARYFYDHQPELGMDSTMVVTRYTDLDDA